MKSIHPHIDTGRSGRFFLLLLLAAALSAAVAAEPPSGRAADAGRRLGAPPLVYRIAYTAHNGVEREATVLLPAGYGPRRNPPLPLVISPHGRGATGRSNAKFWGNLPTVGRFAVVNPDGMGRRLDGFSYGYAGQIDDLARMPRIVARKLPWVRIDRRRVYALGSSMGGQETLLLVARHPRLLAGAVAMDSVTDLALRYEQMLDLPTSPAFVKRWGATHSACLRSAVRREVGGTPAENPRGYASRSPLRRAQAIAKSGVPLQIWWSRVDRIVTDQATQSGALFRELRRLSPRAPLSAYVGRWAHSTEMRAHSLLPVALGELGLLPHDLESAPRSVQSL
jgi:poly(3-hydroxybutyrate) depolymerase